MKTRAFYCLVLILLSSACSSPPHLAPPALPTGDPDWRPDVPAPSFRDDERPRVVVDGAHGNWHTIDGRFESFADLLRADGYTVDSLPGELTAEALEDVDVLVISNALLGGDQADWVLPTPQAFTDEETSILTAWVASGGSLLLIADHMPFPGAVSDLASKFGAVFYNGFAVPSREQGGNLTFTRTDESLSTHPITDGRDESERVDHVRAFTGQAFRIDRPFEPLLSIPDEWVVLLPQVAWEFPENVAQVSARGLVQGAVLEHERGRVALFGEAAMFTTQRVERDGVVYRVGMNHPEATRNAQFVLNVMHWLSRDLPAE